MAKKKMYTQQEVDDFIEVASEKGIAPAVRELGYPTTPTGLNWFKAKGLTAPTIDSLQQRAADMRFFYQDQEKKYAAQRNIERIVEMLEDKDDLDADAINKLSNALHTAIKTFNLIDGKSTSITESHTKDAIDLGVSDILNSAKARNALIDQDHLA